MADNSEWGLTLANPVSVDRRGNLTEAIVERIVGYIETNELAPGSKLPPERVFIDAFGVSRSSLREALRVLTTLGTIDVRHGDGMYVLSPTAAHSQDALLFDVTEQFALRNLVETRQGIEVAATTAAIYRATDDDLAVLDEYLTHQETDLHSDRRFAWEPLAFEMLIVEMCGNSWLHDIEQMLRQAWQKLSSGLRSSVGRYGEWHAEHLAILASMRSRNVAQAQRLVMAHLSLERFEFDLHASRSSASGTPSQ